MFQDFSAKTSPETGAARLAALRAQMKQADLAAFIVPRSDAWQGEYVAAADARLAWLTGFTGSAGFCIATMDHAGVFIDGRYRVQVKSELDLNAFAPVAWPETKSGPWLVENLPNGGQVGFDPWLHTRDEIDALRRAVDGTSITLVESTNLIDAIWDDRPVRPVAPVRAHPIEYAGETSASKRERLARALQANCAVITLPDSIAWLLNIRGNDVEKNPIVQAFAILHVDARVTLFADAAKFNGVTLDPDVTILPMDSFAESLGDLAGPVSVDPASAPLTVWNTLHNAGIAAVAGEDPCILPKAIKNPAEIAGMEAAHLRDGAAMVEFLSWLDEHAPHGKLTEIDAVTALEECRRATNQLLDISFDTICGAGAHGAIVHYRVNENSNRTIKSGELLLIDSGGQYADGTTDITRTVSVGPVPPDAIEPFTRVMRGMIAISMARWPVGLSGRDLDPLARNPLWQAGWDFDHGTGHGVGAALSVHEGPQRISRASMLPLQAGMILSDEPGYYREGAFGIRCENLLLVDAAPDVAGADKWRAMLAFRTLTWVPFDTRLIDAELLGREERDWLNAYHAEVFAKIGPLVGPHALKWLTTACAPI